MATTMQGFEAKNFARVDLRTKGVGGAAPSTRAMAGNVERRTQDRKRGYGRVGGNANLSMESD
jgi:hypothetical protein